MRKKLLIPILIFLIFNSLNSITQGQNVSPTTFASGGAFITNSTHNLSVTIGEPIIETYTSDSNRLTQGFNQPSLYTIQGVLRYDNSSNTPLRNSSLTLKQGNTIIKSANTSATGQYTFSDLIPGTYTIQPSTALNWGGNNSADALLTLRHFVHMVTLTGLRKKAADVDGSLFVNAQDANGIQKRFTFMISSYPIADWIFENPQISLNIYGLYTLNIKGICAGDANGSYVP